MSLALTVGSRVAYGDRTVDIDGAASLNTVAVRDVATGNLLNVPVGDLTPLATQKKPPDPRGIPQADWDQLVRLSRDLDALLLKLSVTETDLENIAQRHQISVRTLRRRLKSFRSHRQVSHLRPSQRGRRKGARLLDPRVESIIRDRVQLNYLVPERPTIAYLLERVEGDCRKENLPVPSRSSIRRRVDEIDRFEYEARRRGRRAAKQMFELRPGKLVVKQVLELIQIDHSPCDCIVVTDDEHRMPIGRPWLTVAIDVMSRCVVGIYLSLDAPSATSVALCIENAVLPKEPWLRAIGVDASWPMYGVPTRILTDNGKDFRSQALLRGCEQHGISLEFRPVRTPHYGAHIERIIGTLMQRLHLLPGTTFSNVKQRGDYDSESKSIMTLRELREWIIYQITAWYHAREHRSLGQAPLSAWQDGLTTSAGLQLPPIIGAPRDFRIGFLPAEQRLVQRTGIEMWGLRYSHDKLADMVATNVRYPVRFDPRDIRHVYVQLESGEFIEVPCVSEDLKPISLFEHKLQRKNQKAGTDDPALTALRDQCLEQCDDITANAAKLTKRARRRVEREKTRHRDIAANAPPLDTASSEWNSISLTPVRDIPKVEEWT